MLKKNLCATWYSIYRGPIYPILPYEYFFTFVICLLGIMFCFLPLAFYILTFILFDFLPFDFYRF